MALRGDGPGLTPEMLPRMAAFLQNQNAPSRPRKNSRWRSAVGCWAPTTPPPICRRPYRHGGCGGWCKTFDRTEQVKRDRKLHNLSETAAKPEVLAALAAHMTPPYALPESIDENIPGYSKLEIGALPASRT